MVSSWLETFSRIIPGRADSRRAVRAQFERLLRRTGRLEMESIPTGDSRPALMKTTLELVRDDDLVISRPTIGTTQHQLVSGEPLRLLLITDSSRKAAETRCLGRIKIQAGSTKGDGVLYGYRLEMPHEIIDASRREHARIPVEHHLAPKAELLLPSHGLVLRGTLIDISVGGVSMRCDAGCEMIKQGNDALLKTRLPEPVCDLSEFVSIRRINISARRQHAIIGMAFTRRVDRMAALIHQIEQQRAKQQAEKSMGQQTNAP